MNKPILFLLSGFLLLGATSFQAGADTITLTNGEKLQGKVIRETGTAVTVEVQVSASITDERVLQRNEIGKIEKETPDEIAYQAIKGLRPDPEHSFRPDVYDQMCAQLLGFVERFPKSSHLADIKPVLEALQEEEKRVEAGGMKYLGKWLMKKEVEARRVQIEAQEAFDTMKAQAAQNDFISAMNTFALIDKRFAMSRVYPSGIDFARKILSALQKDVANYQGVYTYNRGEFKKVLEVTKPEDKNHLIEGDKREQAQYDAAIADAIKNGVKWPPLFPRSKASLDALQALIPNEQTRLATLDVQKMKASLGLTDEARAAVASGGNDTALNLLDTALKAWPQNEDALYLKKQMLAAGDKSKSTPAQGPSGPAGPKPAAKAAKPTHTPVTSVASVAMDAKPFHKTVRGAALIAVGVIGLVGVLSLVGRFLQKPKKGTK